MKSVLFAIAFILALTAGSASGATITVNLDGSGDYLTIAEAIAAANAGDIIEVAPGTYSGPNNRDLTLWGKDLTIRGTQGSANTIIDCENLGRGFWLWAGESTSTLIEGFTIMNGFTDQGAGINCQWSEPRLVDLVLQGNEATQVGGGISCIDASPSLTNVTLTGNTALHGGGMYCDLVDAQLYDCEPHLTNVTFALGQAEYGGGLYLASGADPLFTDVTFTDNDASQLGGGVYSVAGGVWLNWYNTTFSGNSADHGGGGGCFVGTTGILDGVECRDNRAGGIRAYAADGAGLYFDAAYIQVNNSTFTGNETTRCGGAVFVTDARGPDFDMAVFTGNKAESGGALGVRACDEINLFNVDFDLNVAEDGGAVFCDENGWTNIISGTFTNNSADRGGALRADYGFIGLTGGTLTSNTAVEGGGAYNEGFGFWFPLFASMIIDDSSFTGNTADYGGALYCTAGDISLLTDVEISDNSAELQGGGVYCNDAQTTFNGTTFSGNDGRRGGGMTCVSSQITLIGGVFDANEALWGGGGIQCTDNSTLTASETTFSGNDAMFGGGMISKSDSHVDLTDVTFEQNTAEYGGGLRCESGSAVLDSVLFSRNAAEETGGGFSSVGTATVSVTYTTFFDNDAPQGSAITCATSGQFSNCTVARGAADPGGSLFLTGASCTPEISNTIVAFSDDGSAMVCENGANPTITHCCVYGNADGDDLCGNYYDNMFVDPVFCDLISGNLTLHISSPCLPANNSWGELVGAHVKGCGKKIDDPPEQEIEPPIRSGDAAHLPNHFHLYPPSPNPSRGQTVLSCSVPSDGIELTFEIYNMKGQLVRTLTDGPIEAGLFMYVWDCKDERSRDVASGVYLTRARLGEEELREKLILVR